MWGRGIMKRLLSFFVAVMVMLGLCACRQILDPDQQLSEDSSLGSSESDDQPDDPPPPEHSSLYLNGVSPEDMITYFNEVVLNMEYTDGAGDATLVQKWTDPIRCRIVGRPTQEDLTVLDGLFAQLNEIDGFPGIFVAEGEDDYNVTLSFLDADEFRLAFSSFLHGEEADGAVQFWYYTNSNEIYNGRVGYRTDISQQIRNSVLLEEIVNLLGLNDTVLRPDSIVYQYSSDSTQLSTVDWVLLKLLYDPAIQCGMNRDACLSILNQLYY